MKKQKRMTIEELRIRLLLAPNPTEEIVYLVGTIDYETMLPKYAARKRGMQQGM